MGIEKFFSTVNRNFKIINTIDLNNTESNDLIQGKFLLIDFNSIIHNSSSKLINELNQSHSTKDSKTEYHLNDIEYLIIKEINNFLISLLERFDLTKLEQIFIAIDGVPTFAKILEQKKRRFIGDFVNKLLEKYSLPFNWSKNNISPGTIFMNKVSDYLKNIKLISKNKLVKKEDLILKPKDYEFFSKIKKIEISDYDVEGEGEMKIFDLINNLNTKDKIIFFSPDADVILLSMISKNSDFIDVLRYDNNHNNLSIIDIQLLKQTIYSYCLDRLEGSEYEELNIRRLIRDLVFIFTIFGNDFLPKCEAIQTNYDFLFLIDMYLINLIDNGYLLLDNDIITSNFHKYLIIISHHEKRLLFRNSYQNIHHNYNYANQTNFLIDLLKLKTSSNVSEITGNKFGEPFYNFHNNLLFYIDPFKILDTLRKNKPKTKFHGCLEFYLYDRNKLFEIVQQSLKYILPLNAIFTIDIANINENSSYEKLRETKYQSKIKKHLMNMKELSPREVEIYLMENRLDKYYNLFNPINEFYLRIMKTRKIDESFYYKKYFDGNDRKTAVNAYLKGFRWVYQYYFTRLSEPCTGKQKINSIDETWYYPYFKAPLFETMVTSYSSSILETKQKYKKLDITPLEQLLYITPVRMSDLSKPEFYSLFVEYKNKKFIDEDLVKSIRIFIERHPQFFYNLDEIYYSVNTGNLNKNLFDCSNSSFISKCHYEILNYVVDINQFTNKLKQILH
jgi:5'-3' exonuclease